MSTRRGKRAKRTQDYRVQRVDDPNFHHAVAESRRRRRMEQRTKNRQRRERDPQTARAARTSRARPRTGIFGAGNRVLGFVVKRVRKFPHWLFQRAGRWGVFRLAKAVALHAYGRVAGVVTPVLQRIPTKSVRKIAKVAAVVASVGIVAAIALIIPQMSVFAVKHIAVTQTSAVSDVAIRNTIDTMTVGETIYTIDADAIATRVSELSFVHGVEVRRHFPSTLEIAITEYEPLAFGISGNTGWLVASDGRVLSPARLDDWKGRIPIVRLNDKFVTPGDRLENEASLEFLRDIPQTFPGTFRAIDHTNVGYVGYLTTGVRIIFGSGDDRMRKMLVAQRLVGMYGAGRKRTVQYIDVSVPERPAALNLSDE